MAKLMAAKKLIFQINQGNNCFSSIKKKGLINNYIDIYQ